MLKNFSFRNLTNNKMQRPAIRVKLMITSEDDKQFSDPVTFENMLDASLATGLTDRGIRMAYNSARESMKKRNGFIYDFKWEEPDPAADPTAAPRAKLSRNSKECIRSLKPLTFDDRKDFFLLYLVFDDEYTWEFTSIVQASRCTGISICALGNACNKGNWYIKKRTRDMEMYGCYWSCKCKDCSWISFLLETKFNNWFWKIFNLVGFQN